MAADQTSVQNLSALRKKQFMVKFDLEGTSYSPLENIGAGAYGVVCSATDARNNEQVAIKKIPSIFDQLTLVKRTYREIRILKHFKHDNIISIREILKPRDLHRFKDIYIVFDLMESDLHRIIQSKQDLTDDHVRFFVYQILRGLKYIHSANVIHRDLKPSNLLVNENCTLKIGDFGLSRGIDQGHGKQKFAKTLYVATRWYRAPELMLSVADYSAAIDVWSVGCIFGELLNKKPLFPGVNVLHQLKLIIDVLGTPPKEFLKLSKSNTVPKFIEALGIQQPKSLRELYPQAPRKAVDLLGKMLAFNPQKRITVEQALRHPYLNKYHDPDDEPICTPAFNFDFEKKNLTVEELKTELIKEIMEYHASDSSTPATASVNGPSCSSTNNNIQSDGLKMDSTFADITLTTLADLIPDNSSPEDIEMLSASLGKVLSPVQVKALEQEINWEDFGIKIAKPEEKPKIEVKTEPKPEDTKAVIKAALLKAIERKKQLAEAKAKASSGNVQSKEDVRKKKREKVLQAKKKRTSGKDDKLTLSEEDKKLLEKWETMHGQSQRKPQVENKVQSNALSTDSGTTLSQNPGVQQVLFQPVLIPVQNMGLPNQGQIVLNVVQAPVATVQFTTTVPGGKVETTINSNDADLQVQPKNTALPIHATESIAHSNDAEQQAQQTDKVSSSIRGAFRDSTQSNLTRSSADSSTTSRSSFHSDHTYYKPLQTDTPESTFDNQLKTDAWLSALTQKVSRSHIDDLTLAGTPKGSGSGYGLGEDFDSAMNDVTASGQAAATIGDRVAQSAGLSATLLADWIDVTRNMDPSEFENLQQELEMDASFSFDDF